MSCVPSVLRLSAPQQRPPLTPQVCAALFCPLFILVPLVSLRCLSHAHACACATAVARITHWRCQQAEQGDPGLCDP